MSSGAEARQIADMQRRLDQLEALSHIRYETSSFAPILVGSGAAGTFTYTANTSVVEWARIGNQLFYNGRIVITAISVAPTLNMSINGFPYAGVSDATMAIAGGGAMTFWRGITLPANYTQVALNILNGATGLNIVRSGSNQAGGIVQGSEIVLVSGQLDLRFTGDYRVG